MTGFDFTPLFRTAIGFDRLAQLMDAAASTAEVPSYPPLQHREDWRRHLSPNHGGGGLPPREP